MCEINEQEVLVSASWIAGSNWSSREGCWSGMLEWEECSLRVYRRPTSLPLFFQAQRLTFLRLPNPVGPGRAGVMGDEDFAGLPRVSPRVVSGRLSVLWGGVGAVGRRTVLSTHLASSCFHPALMNFYSPRHGPI